MPKREHAFNVMLSEQEYQSLNKLAAESSCTCSFIIRQSILWRSNHQLGQLATCADGQRCASPHLVRTNQGPPHP